MRPFRIGLLGAARIAPFALLRPARRLEGIEVRAVASRSVRRAERYAVRYGIPVVHRSYQDLVEDPELDAVYVPLPNSHHAWWSIQALQAGRHVLCEKPLAANAEDAERMAVAADEAECRLVEAFHWRYHPMAERAIALVREGVLGRITHVEASFCIPLPRRSDIRYSYDLAGGAMMDTGCYTVSLVRHLSGMEPEVRSARARLASKYVDRAMEAELVFPNGASGHIRASLWSARLLSARARVVGTEGELRLVNPIAPQFGFGRLKLVGRSGTRVERFRLPATYDAQLQAFRDHVLEGRPVPTGAWDGVRNMRVVDAVYQAAGLPPRIGWWGGSTDDVIEATGGGP